MSQPALLALWRSYRERGDVKARDRLVLSLAPIVKSIVARKAREIPPYRDVEDFISCGLEALVRSIDRYDPAKGATLEQFAWTRIHGAVLDELRAFDWAPRSLRRLERDLNRVRERFAILHGRAPSRIELSDALAITPKRLDSLLEDLDRTEISSLNDTITGQDGSAVEWVETLPSGDHELDPELCALQKVEIDRFRVAFERLEPRERHVAILLYVQDLTLRETGEVLGISESRVCQLHTRLKSALHEQLRHDEPMLLDAA